MRMHLVGVLAFVLIAPAAAPLRAQQAGSLTGVAHTADRAPLVHFRVNVRHARTGELADWTTSNRAGQFSFTTVQPGPYVVEIVDAAGQVVGLSPSLAIAEGATVTVTIGASAAGALADAGSGGLGRLGLGPLASVAIAGASSPLTAVVATRAGKIVVCHQISPAMSQTLEIRDKSRSQHLEHGDTLGACPDAPGR